MANLLYKEYKTGCWIYWYSTADDYSPDDYCYGYGDIYASYYADLKPNTTYTIQRIDDSTRFRIGLSSRDLKTIEASSKTTLTTPFSWGFRADTSEPVTFTTGDSNIYLVVYYTNDSNYNVRCMLNEGNEIQPYEAPTTHFPWLWIMQDGKPVPPNVNDMYEAPMSKPYPKALWRIDSGINGGLPWNELFQAEISKHYPVEQNQYICVYDMHTQKDDFIGNGLAVLCPTSCKVTEQLNGGWNVFLEHPMDNEGKWRYILEFNILKVQGQLYRITKVEQSRISYGNKIIAYGEHIFYQMNDSMIYPNRDIFGNTGKMIMRSALVWAYIHPEDGQTIYSYDYDSDISYDTIGTKIYIGLDKWRPIGKAMSPNEFFLGSDGFISTFGGELYRDNFYFSINNRMEGAEDNAFEIRVGLNLKGIKRTVDLSSFCTYLRGEDNHGSWGTIAWVPWTVRGGRGFPHHIVRYKKFTYNTENYSFDVFWNDFLNYYATYCKPVLSFEVDLEDVRKNPDYKEFYNNFRYKVGDTGRIYDERLGINQIMEITKTVTDGITGKVLEVNFGSQLSFTRSYNYSSAVPDSDFIPDPQGAAIQFKDKNGTLLFDKNHVKLINEVNLSGRT